MNIKKTSLIIIVILLIDQLSKIYIKTNFVLGESYTVFSWFKIHFIENEGAAWGTKLSDIFPISDKSGKLILTLFRILAVFGIWYWLLDTIKRKSSKLLTAAIAMILAGAIGNIIDSVFYGILFNDSYGQLATFLAEDPYGSLFHGKVVDMLYFPLINTVWPEWVPFVGGKVFRFFEPVFNIADSSISIGVAILILFNKKLFQSKKIK